MWKCADRKHDYPMIRILTAIHFSALLGLCLYRMHRLWLIRCLLAPKGVAPSTPDSFAAPEEFSVVTVQLPGGGTVRARGSAAVGERVFVRDGVLEAVAPNLALEIIEI